jgi:tripartite-type tricarboxylate transporter receptor subunit TctC
MGFPNRSWPPLGLSRRAFVAAGLALSSRSVRAQQRPYPIRRIDMLIPFPPGTGNDVVGRVVGKQLADTLGQPVVVDNRAGAFGNIAMEATRRAAPDGYTTAMASTSFSVNKWTMLSSTYSLDDFTPIAMVATQPYSLMVGKHVAAKDLRELIDFLKKDPTKFNGGQGSGTGYFMLALLNKELGANVATVAYKGTTEAVMDLLSARIDLLFAPITTVLPYYASGEAKILGVSGSKRAALMPDVATFTEVGHPALDISTWFALLGPKGIADSDVHVLSSAVAKAVQVPDTISVLAKNGIAPDYRPPSDLATFLKEDLERWRDIVQASGFVPQ